MAWYPGAVRMELQPESDDQPAIRPTQFVLHSIAAPWTKERTFEYWRDSTNLESHFGQSYDGSIAQYIGTETRADATYLANRRPDGTGAVAIETASNNDHSDPWTDAQVEGLISLGVWLHRQHGIPLRICRTASDPGYGYHRLHTDWAKGGTDCPGDARVRQFREVIFPSIVARANGQTPDPSEEDDDMPLTPADLDAIEQRIWRHTETNALSGKPVDMGAVMAWMDHVHVNGNKEIVRQLTVQQAAITALATQLGQLDGVDTATLVAAVKAAIAEAVIAVDVTVTGTPIPKES